jgi:hypothetical protein
MTRIGVLGDTHGKFEQAIPVLKSLEVDLILHTGDYYRDAIHLSQALGIKVIGVLGNCDTMSHGPKEKILELEGKRIYLTHGHLYGVKTGCLNLFYRAKEVEAHLVIYGHTHREAKETIEDTIIFNPGSPSKPRNNRPTLGLVIINEGQIQARIMEI